MKYRIQYTVDSEERTDGGIQKEVVIEAHNQLAAIMLLGEDVTVDSIKEEKQMEAYQQRVVEEKKELDSKIERLSDFTHGSVFEQLDSAEKIRMIRQLQHMDSYSKVLGERIENFK